MTNKKIEEQRERIIEQLERLIEVADEIEGEGTSVPRSRGTAYRSLKPKSGMCIVYSSKGFTARYQRADGTWYEVEIQKRTPK